MEGPQGPGVVCVFRTRRAEKQRRMLKTFVNLPALGGYQANLLFVTISASPQSYSSFLGTGEEGRQELEQERRSLAAVPKVGGPQR